MNDTITSDEIDLMKKELLEAGWQAKTSVIWKHPTGRLYLGPAWAWKVMQREKNP